MARARGRIGIGEVDMVGKLGGDGSYSSGRGKERGGEVGKTYQFDEVCRHFVVYFSGFDCS